MSHPNQLALPNAVDRWIQQSQSLPGRAAYERLNDKLAIIAEAINVIASDVDELPTEFEGLSVIDLMAAQARLTVEANVALRFADLQVAA